MHLWHVACSLPAGSAPEGLLGRGEERRREEEKERRASLFSPPPFSLQAHLQGCPGEERREPSYLREAPHTPCLVFSLSLLFSTVSFLYSMWPCSRGGSLDLCGLGLLQLGTSHPLCPFPHTHENIGTFTTSGVGISPHLRTWPCVSHVLLHWEAPTSGFCERRFLHCPNAHCNLSSSDPVRHGTTSTTTAPACTRCLPARPPACHACLPVPSCCCLALPATAFPACWEVVGGLGRRQLAIVSL